VVPAAEEGKEASAYADLTFDSYSFHGRSHRGPYLLPHEKIAPQSEMIIVNWVPYTRNKDYTLDYGLAAIHFVKPLGPDDEITVRYAHAKGAPARKPTPITGDTELYRSETSQVKLLTGYQEDPKGKTEALGNYGLDMNTRWIPKLQVSSTFLVSDRVERAPGTGLFAADSTRSAGQSAAGSAPDNTAMQTIATLDGGRSRMVAEFTRAGEEYQGVGADKKRFKPGTQNLNLSATHTVSDNVALRAAHTAVAQEKQGAKIADTTTTSGGVNVKLGAKSDVDLSTTRVDAQGRPTTEQHQLTSKVQATDEVAVRLAATRTQVDGGKTTDAREVSSQVRPNDRVAVDVSAGETLVDGEKATETRQVKSQFKPTDNVNVVATYGETEHVQSQTDTRNVAVQAAAGEALKVKGTFSQTDPAQGDATKAHTADVEYQPLQGLKMTGTVAEQTVGEASRSATGGALVASLRHDLQVRGAYTNRESDGLPDLGDTRDFRLSFTPFDKLQLQAQLTQRPAKELWKPEDVEQQSVRIGSQLSPSLNVSGGYSSKAWLTADRTMEITDVRLQVDFFRRHSVYAGLSLSDDAAGTSALREKLYSLGYAYRLGSALSLSVDGTLTERDGPSADSQLNDRPEYNVEGKLSAHF